MLLQGQRDPDNRSHEAKLAILTVYGPTKGDGDNSNWNTIARTLLPTEKSNPQLQFVHELITQIKLLHAKGAQVIVGGDFNMHAMDPLMLSIEEACGMENVLEELHLPPEEWYTYEQSPNMASGRSRIDHVLASVGMSEHGLITRAGIYKTPLMRSKHRATLIELDVGRILHLRDTSLPTPLPPPHRPLQFADKDSCEKFGVALDDLAKEAGLRNMYSQCLLQVQAKQDMDKIRHQLDKLMDTAAELVQRAAHGLKKYKHKTGTKHKNGMSPEMVRRAAAVRRLQHLTREWYTSACATGVQPAVYTTALRTIRNAYYLTDRYVDGDKLTVIDELARLGIGPPPDDDDKPEWAYWVHCLEEAVTTALSELHGRYRRRMREDISANTAKREQAFTDGKIAKYIRSILNIQGSGGLPKQILSRDPETGVPILLTAPGDIKESERTVMGEWLGWFRKRWFISDEKTSKVDHPTLRDDEAGRQRRRDMQYATGPVPCEEYQIPTAFADVIEASKVKTSKKTNKQMTPDAYGNIRHDLMHYDTWDAYINMKKKMVAPGKSGMQYVHLAAMSADMRHLMCDIANLAIQSGYIYAMWKRELIYRIPKVPGDPDQLKQRPLKLQEVLRKITLGIKKNELLKVWHAHKLISPEQFAFLKGWSTAEPIMIKKLALEISRLKRECILALDEDLKRAYDQTERFVKEMSLRRFGVPEDMIEWIMEFDRGNENIVLTAYGDSDPFEAEMGAWAQGDDFSPIGWVVTMDWLVQVVHIHSTMPVRIGNAVVEALLYADDATYLQRARNAVRGILLHKRDIPAALTAIQKIADATELYCGFTGHQIRVDKSALQFLLWIADGEGGSTMVDKADMPPLYLRQWLKGPGLWEVHLGPPLPFPLIAPHDELRHLGHTESAMGTSSLAAKATLRATRQAARIMGTKQLRASGAKYIAESVLRTRAQYRLTFANSTLQDIARHQTAVTSVINKTIGVYGMPKLLQYGTRGGMGWAQWEDTVNLARLMIFMKFINTPGTMHDLMHAAVEELQNLIGCTTPVLETLGEQACTQGLLHADVWMFQLWQWMITRGVTVHNVNLGLPLTGGGDLNIIEYTTSFHNGPTTLAHHRAMLQAGCATFRVHNLSDIVQRDGCTLTPLFRLNGPAHRQHPTWRTAILNVFTHARSLHLKRHLRLKVTASTSPLKPGDVVGYVTKHFLTRTLAVITHITDGAIHARHLTEVTRHACRSKWHDMGGDPDLWSSLSSYKSGLYITTGVESIITHATRVDHIRGPLHQRLSLYFVTSNGQWLDKICTSYPAPAPPSFPPSEDPYQEDTLIGAWHDQSHVPLSTRDVHYCLQFGATIHGCSDGSVSSDHRKGTYAWVIVARLHQVQYVLAAGSGLCDTLDNPAIGALDSTRMESIGIVAGLRAWAQYEESSYTHIDWICDNSGAVATYNSYRGLDMRGWQKLENRDIWGYLSTWHDKPLRQLTNVTWHRGHPEKRMKSADYSPDDWLNVWADALAGFTYKRDIPTCTPWFLPNHHPIVVCYDQYVLTGSVATTLSKYIGRANGTMYSATHAHITDLTQVDLLQLDRTEAKLKSPHHRLAQTRRVWELYPTASRLHKFSSDNHPMCHCGAAPETFLHTFHTCIHPEAIINRQLASCALADLWDKYFPLLTQAKWADFWSSLFHIDDEGNTARWPTMLPTQPPLLPPSDSESDSDINLCTDDDEPPTAAAAQCKSTEFPEWYTTWCARPDTTNEDIRSTRNQVRLGSAPLWKGLFAPGLHGLLTAMKHLNIKAEAFLTEISHYTLHYHIDTWRARCRAKRGETTPRTKQGETLLALVRATRLQLAPYAPVPTMDEFYAMVTPRLRQWHRWATHKLTQMSPTKPSLFSFFRHVDAPPHHHLWNSHTRTGHMVNTHQLRPGPLLTSKRSCFVLSRPMFRPTVSYTGEPQLDYLTVHTRKGSTTAQAVEFQAHTGVTIEEYDCPLPCGLRPLTFLPPHVPDDAPYWAAYNTRMQEQYTTLMDTAGRPRRQRLKTPKRTRPKGTGTPQVPAHSTIAVMLGRSLTDEQQALSISLRKAAHREQAAKRRRLTPPNSSNHTTRIDSILPHVDAPCDIPQAAPSFSPPFTEAMNAAYDTGDSDSDSDFAQHNHSDTECSEDNEDDDTWQNHTCGEVDWDIATFECTDVPFPPPPPPALTPTYISHGRGTLPALAVTAPTGKRKRR